MLFCSSCSFPLPWPPLILCFLSPRDLRIRPAARASISGASEGASLNGAGAASGCAAGAAVAKARVVKSNVNATEDFMLY